MAGVRDPAFWKRFSMAVHMDEETGSLRQAELKHKDSWLARQERKKSRHYVCWMFWLLIIILIGTGVGVIAYLAQNGTFDGGKNLNTSER